MQVTWVWSLSWDILEQRMTTHSSILTWKISWTEEPGELWSMGLQRVGYDWVADTCYKKVSIWALSESLTGSFIKARLRAGLDDYFPNILLPIIQFSCSAVSDSLQPHGLQHSRPPCPSPGPGACSNSCPLSWWYHPIISSSVVPFSSLPQSFPISGSFQMSQLFV